MREAHDCRRQDDAREDHLGERLKAHDRGVDELRGGVEKELPYEGVRRLEKLGENVVVLRDGRLDYRTRDDRGNRRRGDNSPGGGARYSSLSLGPERARTTPNREGLIQNGQALSSTRQTDGIAAAAGIGAAAAHQQTQIDPTGGTPGGDATQSSLCTALGAPPHVS